MLPTVVVNGVYRVRHEEGKFREQLLDYYCKGVDMPPKDVIAFVDRVIPLVLMDISISGLDERFDVGEFTQAMPSAPQKAWQVPWRCFPQMELPFWCVVRVVLKEFVRVVSRSIFITTIPIRPCSGHTVYSRALLLNRLV
jgi:hypothetical protein